MLLASTMNRLNRAKTQSEPSARGVETPKGTTKPMPYVVTQVCVKQNGKWMLTTQQGTNAPAGR